MLRLSLISALKCATMSVPLACRSPKTKSLKSTEHCRRESRVLSEEEGDRGGGDAESWAVNVTVGQQLPQVDSLVLQLFSILLVGELGRSRKICDLPAGYQVLLSPVASPP